jgi:hypothetical protein
MSDRPTYAHDPDCNTIHEAGPEPCPPPREDPLLAAEETLVVRPGDVLVIRVSPDRIRSLQDFEDFTARLEKAVEGRMPGAPRPLVIVADQLAVRRADGE